MSNAADQIDAAAVCRTDAAKHVAVSHLGRDARLVLTYAGEHSGDDVVGSCGAGKVIRR
ncbi:MAG: hypothetical protein NT138_08285 [Planctomycetales bacterium]|nr:hypothetical protein [Planctomycetales bacterium]